MHRYNTLDDCGTVCTFCSKSVVRNKGSPAEVELANLERSLENEGYACGSEVGSGGSKFYSVCALSCGDLIESTYYTHSIDTRGERTATKDMCSV